MCKCLERQKLIWLIDRIDNEYRELELREEIQPSSSRAKRMATLRIEKVEIQGRLDVLPNGDCEHKEAEKKANDITLLEGVRDSAARLIAEYHCGLDIDIKSAKRQYVQASLKLYELHGEEAPPVIKKLL